MTFLKSRFTRLSAALGVAVTMTAAAPPTPARAGPDAYIGDLMLFGGNFCPRNWANADGQLLAISSYTALFSILGTTYGGDGRTTFGLPDLRARTPIHTGSGPGLPNYPLGAKGGAASFNLTVAQLPNHNHNVNAVGLKGNKGGPGTDFLAIPEQYNQASTNDDVSIYHNGPTDKVMDPAMIANQGGSQTVNLREPYQVLRWCIALQGIYPSRN